MVKVGWVTCPRCKKTFDVDKTMLQIPNVYFHCPYCHLEPIRLNEVQVNLGRAQLVRGERYQPM